MAIFNSYVKLPRGTPKIIRIISSSLMAHRLSTMFTLGRIKFKASNDTLGTESKPMMHDNDGSWFIGIVIGNPKRVIFFPSFFLWWRRLGLNERLAWNNSAYDLRCGRSQWLRVLLTLAPPATREMPCSTIHGWCWNPQELEHVPSSPL